MNFYMSQNKIESQILIQMKSKMTIKIEEIHSKIAENIVVNRTIFQYLMVYK